MAQRAHIRPEFVLEDLPALMQENECTGYRIRDGKAVVCSFVSDDDQEALNSLISDLQRLIKNRSLVVYTLEGYKYVKDKLESIFTINFKVYEAQPVYAQQYNPQAVTAAVTKDDIREIVSEIINAQDVDEEEAVENRGIIGEVVDLIKDEQSRSAIIAAISGIISAIRNNMGNRALPIAVNGLREDGMDAELMKVINELKGYDVDLLNDLKRLLILAKNNTSTFDYLLSSLRKIVPDATV